ncbi:hypothetical protein V6N13_034025 [Hibiscus sabdariffa]
MSTPLVTPMPKQAAPPMVSMPTPSAHSFSTFDLRSPSAQPPPQQSAQPRSSTPTKRKVTTNRIPVGTREHVAAHGPRGRTIMQGIVIYTNEATRLQILNASFCL